MASIPALVNKTMKVGDWLFESDLKAFHEASDAAHARRREIERAVTFDEVLEEVAQFSEPRQQLFMSSLREGIGEDEKTFHLLHRQAMERVVEKKLAQPDAPRFSVTYCSQCGKALGPGNNGVSHCYRHGGL